MTTEGDSGAARSRTLHGAYHPNGHCPNGECAALTVKARINEAHHYERAAAAARVDAQIALQRAQHAQQKASDLYAEVNRCHHCGRPDEADGDHTCLCSHRDEDCPDHPLPRSRANA